VTWLCRATALYPYLFAGCEVLFVFWFAYNTRWHGFNRYGDYSYGIYLWGYPAQQMVAAVFGTLPFLSNAFAGLCLALLFAVASWYAIEKPALRLKGAPSALGRWIARRLDQPRKQAQAELRVP
jgi:peptidoglycan/LPS O-acetylase OafA/YrhL